MRKLTAEDYVVMPWKNGGGTTTQLAISPAGANLENFDWRISTAQVASDGPFSAFPGVDRSLAVLRGHGLILAEGDGERCRLGEGADPFVFRGEQRITASLKGGPVVDFNVMTRSSVCAHTLEVLEIRGTHRYTSRSDLMLVHVVQGFKLACLGSRGQLEVCKEGESLLVDWREETEIELSALPSLSVCVVHITFKEPRND